MLSFKLILLLCAMVILSGCQSFSSDKTFEASPSQYNQLTQPIVIAHRGASGYLPEHTLEAAVLAYAQGADYIEQDLVLTQDGELIVLHDIVLDTTTNVAEVFPEKKRSDGRYYAIDFTLAQIKQLRKFERRNHSTQAQVYPQRYSFTQGFQISTWQEQVELLTELNRQFNQNIGWYPELKQPEWHLQNGLDIAAIFVEKLNQQGLNSPDTPIFTQCFHWQTTQRLKNELGLQTKLVQLIAEDSWGESSTNYTYLKSEAGVAEMAKVVDGVGPWIPQLLNAGFSTTGFTNYLHNANLLIHPYTHRKDQPFADKTDAQLLHMLLQRAKIQGLFTDHPDVVNAYLHTQNTKKAEN